MNQFSTFRRQQREVEVRGSVSQHDKILHKSNKHGPLRDWEEILELRKYFYTATSNSAPRKGRVLIDSSRSLPMYK